MKTELRFASMNGLILSFLVATSSLAVPQTAPAARANKEKQITVRVRNYTGIDSGLLLKAEATANKILREAGAESVWIVCFDGTAWSGNAACTTIPGLEDLTVNVRPLPASQGSHLREGVFGYANEEGEQGFGCDAWVFIDPIERFAVANGLNWVQLLGHVFAHEVGHLLLGVNSHSGIGLMRAQWSRRELLAANQGGLFFSAAEGKRLQKAVLARWQADSLALQTVQAR
jgi:hypothetical protein